jgi:hypothetical protein
MKTGGRDLNTTGGFELKSIASDGRGARPIGFKDPPMLRSANKDAPTAENLKRLNTKMTSGSGARSDAGGPKSARGS